MYKEYEYQFKSAGWCSLEAQIKELQSQTLAVLFNPPGKRQT